MYLYDVKIQDRCRDTAVEGKVYALSDDDLLQNLMTLYGDEWNMRYFLVCARIALPLCETDSEEYQDGE